MNTNIELTLLRYIHERASTIPPLNREEEEVLDELLYEGYIRKNLPIVTLMDGSRINVFTLTPEGEKKYQELISFTN